MVLDPVGGAPVAPRIVLASASPRRRQILTAVGLPYEPLALDVDEQPLPGEEPEALARRLASAKARIGAQQAPGAVVLGADTVVVLGDEALGKPADADEAVAMLRRLRGRGHRVITAVAAARGGEATPVEVWCRAAITQVQMRPYTDAEIAAYVASGDPFDKAGAYAIQHPTFRPVAHIAGCFLTVVGLPLPEVYAVLARVGVTAPRPSAAALQAICPGCTDEAVLRAE